MNTQYQRIVDHLTEFKQYEIFKGFDRFGKGIVDRVDAFPLSFAHDDDADRSVDEADR